MDFSYHCVVGQHQKVSLDIMKGEWVTDRSVICGITTLLVISGLLESFFFANATVANVVVAILASGLDSGFSPNL